MPKLIDWPCDLTRPLDVSYFIQWTSRESGASLLGVPQIIGPEVGVWRVDLTIPREFDGDRLKRLEAKVAQMRGRTNVASLCICDPYKYGSNVSPKQWPFTDGTWFSDGTGFVDAASGAQGVVVTVAAEAGDNKLTIGLTNPTIPPLRIGDMFSANGFLYRVTESAPSGAIEFEPQARQAIPVGTALATDPPRIWCRFADDGQGQRTRERLKWGSSITLTFVEAFDR